MRSIATVLIGISPFLLTSCSEVPPQSLDSGAVESSEPSDPVDQENAHAANDKHGSARIGDRNAEPHRKPQRADHAGDHAPHSKTGHAPHATASHKTPAQGHRQQDAHHHGETKNAASKIAIGEKVPDFSVTLDGKARKLSEFQKDTTLTADGTLVLTFWCSFCHSCRHVEADLDKLAKKHRGKAGVIAIDASFGETLEEVTAFAKKKGLTLPIALSEDGTAADVFGVKSTTTTVVIDRDGKLQYFGQFADRQHTYAADALDAVLARKDVPIKRTRPKG
ncbi:MAG: TlpA disulfide reductase family protein [Planctomycetota bacterium]|nr:TlpA disulfide reductase family protein [Planctomycetota bacterium]